MKTLGIDWFIEGSIDFEYKKYVLLAYLQEINRHFDKRRLYPNLSDLVFHYNNLLYFKQNKTTLQNAFPQRLTKADIAIIGAGTAGTSSARANLTQYGDFDSDWKTADMNAAVIECLLVDFPTPQTGTVYKVTFPNYSSTAPDPLSFTWSGTAWVAQQ